jgi:hypothetical protein
MLETELMTALDFLSLPENMKVARKQFIEHFGEQTHHRLKAANYIKTCTLGDPFGVWIDAVTITVLGTQVLLATKQSNEEQAQHRAEDSAKEAAKKAEAKGLRKNDTRRSWWQFVLGLFLGWILGGILPQDVWNTIRNWFGIAHP